MQRRCGWHADACTGPERVVWARRGVALTTCPRSFISADSEAWIEQYYGFKRFGVPNAMELPARTAHALLLLDQELQKEAE